MSVEDIRNARKSSQASTPPEIIPLKTELLPVEKFTRKLLPPSLVPWVADIVERVQCPPDFVGVTAVTALGSVIGRKAAIYPKRQDDWMVIPNIWGALIGRPSSMKTPAMREGLKPIKRLIVLAREEHKDTLDDYEVDNIVADTTRQTLETKVREEAKKPSNSDNVAVAKQDYKDFLKEQGSQPNERRYIVNDATVEKLGELLNQNPNGLLLERDELTGWLRNLDRADRSSDRAFYLECFDGNGDFVYDRIGRGTMHIQSTTLSIVGGIQPAKLHQYVFQAINHGDGDDGLVQRLQLAVYPDISGNWKNVDRWPDREAKNRVNDIFKSLSDLPDLEPDENGELPGVRFTDEAQETFDQWREELEVKIREPDIHPALESHFTKYRSLMPSLALIFNILEEGPGKAVSSSSAALAAAWCQYLESHAYRIYGSAINPAIHNAKTILRRRAKLPPSFHARDVKNKCWAGLSYTSEVKAALSELVETNHLFMTIKETGPNGGREGISYRWNPRLDEEIL